MIPPETNESQAGYALNLLGAQELVNWAVDAIVSGSDSKNLRILAGLQPPFDQDEIRRLFNAILPDLPLDPLPEQLIIPTYIESILKKMLSEKLSRNEALRRLSDLCIQRNYDRALMDFYNLYYAKWDLDSGPVQWYWKDADHSNIDQIIDNFARQWLTHHAMKQNHGLSL